MRGLHTLLYIYIVLLAFLACTDGDEFTTDSNAVLTFSEDTIHLDTVFSTVPSAHHSFWIYNKNKKGIALETARLERGNQSGFRVNIDGINLGASTGFQTTEVEIPGGDSIRVYVELTSTVNGKTEPEMITDNLMLTLESGRVQRVPLVAYSWDAEIMRNVVVDEYTELRGDKPIVVYGGIEVRPDALLVIKGGTTLYFHENAGINVYGRLICEGQANNEVTLRGDRIDRMFDYLPYDNVAGQWQGIHFYEPSYENIIDYTDLHSTYNGIVVDSSSIEKPKLYMHYSTVHNCQGYGLKATSSRIEIANSQITNTKDDCLYHDGGMIIIDNCTIAQFYPFDSARGAALRFKADKANEEFYCRNSIITGYADDELFGEQTDSLKSFAYYFDSCVLRTPKVETVDSVLFANVIFENPKDTMGVGRKHFTLIDTENLRYNFDLDSTSVAIDKANTEYALPRDRKGRLRDQKPDIGAYERIKD